jgi:hypothetical protein
MKLHPAIDPDYPAGVSAFRQLAAGAKPVFRANHYALYHREGFDHCYYRGLCLRHSNGETGKYETYTYEATPELLQWARDNLIYPTVRELLGRCGINEKNEIRNWRRRDRTAQQADRPKGFPSVRDLSHRVLVESQAPDGVTVNEEGEISGKALTQWYVHEFCRLNGLTP